MSDLVFRATAEAARDLWRAVVHDARTPEAVAAEADRLWGGLRGALGRWIGTAGYQALLERSLGIARAEHASLASLTCAGGEEVLIAATARTHGAGEVAAGMVTLLTVLIDLLGRILGGELAIHLVSHAIAPGPGGVVSTILEDG